MATKHILPVILSLAVVGCSDGEDKVTFFSLLPPSSRDIVQPANLPPDNFDGEFWVDRNGCSYIKTGNGQWVPRMNLDRTRMCDPSLVPSAIQMAESLAGLAPEAAASVGGDAEIAEVSEVRPSQTIPPTYVQVGSYSDTGVGLGVREKFASMGFPVVGQDQAPPEGRAITVVLGPYSDSGFLEDALETAKSLGHNDAYVFQNQ